MKSPRQYLNKKLPANNQHGMTVFEVIISIVAGGIVSAGMATQVANTVKYSQLIRQQTQAVFLVEEKLEEIIYRRKTAGTVGVDYAALFPNETPITGDFAEYSRYFEFTDDTTGTCPTHTAADCLEVTVTVKADGSFRAGTKVVLLKGGPWVSAPLPL